jgi:ankyrin repeat protein
MVKILLDKNINIKTKNNNNIIFLFYIARTGNETILQIFVRYGTGASIIERNKAGNTVLHNISCSGNKIIIRLLINRLIELNADVNILNNSQKITLYRTIANRHSIVVAILLATGTNSINKSKPLFNFNKK